MDTARDAREAALADACRLLGACVRLPTPQLAASVADGSLAASVRALLPHLGCSEERMRSVVRRLTLCQPAEPAAALTSLRREYTRLFAHPVKPIVPICESLFTSALRGEDEKPLLMVNRRAMELDEVYRAAGYERTHSAAVPPDHMETELAFLTVLLDKRASADAAAFLERYAGTWAPTFFALVEDHARTPEYALFGSLGCACFER